MSEKMKRDGWNAIDQAMEEVYGNQEPERFTPIISYMLGGDDPLDGISIYIAQKPIEHWHFVTYGFSELYEKETDDKEHSGYGFELTCRIVKKADELEPPRWAVNLLQNLARYVFRSGNVFGNGDYFDTNGPICLDADTELTALAFISDPALSTLETPNGKINMLQVVGITADELETIQIWNTIGVLNASMERIPSYVTDLSRASVLDDPKVAEAIQKRSEEEGSSTGFLFNNQISWIPMKKGLIKKKPGILTIGGNQAQMIGRVIKGRMIKDAELTLVSHETTVTFSFAETSSVMEKEGVIHIVLNEAAVEVLVDELGPEQKEFSLPTIKNIMIKIV